MKIQLILFNLFFSFQILFSQSVSSDPVIYLGKVSDGYSKVQGEYLGYISAVAHGKSAKKVAKQRSELLSAVSSSRTRVANLPEFKGDTLLRYSAYNYFNTTYVVLKEDYAKIMDLEDIADQSYDNMEAYITMQKIANDKVKDAFNETSKLFDAFAAKNDVKIIETNSEENKKSIKAAKVMDYYNSVFLAFFKCNKGEVYLVDAISKKDINAIEQTKVALQSYIYESNKKLDSIGSFEGDQSIINSTTKLIDFYQSELKDKLPIVVDYLAKSERFSKLKEAIDKKSSSERTKDDIEQFNKAVADINIATGLYNKATDEMNSNRTKLVNDLNKANTTFLDKHTPVYRK